MGENYTPKPISYSIDEVREILNLDEKIISLKRDILKQTSRGDFSSELWERASNLRHRLESYPEFFKEDIDYLKRTERAYERGNNS